MQREEDDAELTTGWYRTFVFVSKYMSIFLLIFPLLDSSMIPLWPENRPYTLPVLSSF